MHIDLTHLEELAKFRVAEGERERFVQSFENILDYVGQLQQVETDEADAISTITPNVNVFREDVVVSDSVEHAAVVAAFPEQKAGLLQVPGVFAE
jgi:aspartyl-tRNA(Asn)/glutamyl-tRNA(Gln) amidotransferase subunit C